MVTVAALEFHVLLRLITYRPGDKALANFTIPIILSLTLRVSLRRELPSHHHDFSLREPSVSSAVHISQFAKSILLLLCILIEVLIIIRGLRLLLLWRSGLFFGLLNWLLYYFWHNHGRLLDWRLLLKDGWWWALLPHHFE